MKQFKPDVKKLVKEQSKATDYPQYVKRITFNDVGKFERSIGKYLVYMFKVKGEFASPVTALGDTIIEITEKEYKGMSEDEIKEKIVDIYRSGKPLDTVISHQTFIPSTGEVIKPDKKKTTEKAMGKNGEVDQKSFRDRLNEKEIAGLKELCEKYTIDIKKYDHLSGGLLKMSLVNKLVGTIGKMLKTGSITTAEVKEL